MSDDKLTIGQVRFGPMIDPQPRVDLQVPPMLGKAYTQADMDTIRAADQACIADLQAQLDAALQALDGCVTMKEVREIVEDRDDQRAQKDAAYLERNILVAFLAAVFPAGIKRTNIEGWSPDWHGCVYIDFPWGQASWHYHDSHAHLFSRLPPYPKEWDGHTAESKYEAITDMAVNSPRTGEACMAEIRAIARAEGFADMAAWFSETHGLPFTGTVIYWESLPAITEANAPKGNPCSQ